MQSREDLYARVNNRIIADLEKGVHPWFRPWSAGNTEGRIVRPLRFNFQPYTGVNTLTLWCDMVEKDYSNPVHMTYKGCAEIIPFRVRDWVESARCCAGGRSMQRQGSFAEAEYAGKKKQTRRDTFLAEMEKAVPGPRLMARLAPLYRKGEGGRPPIPLERMLRVYFVQQWYGLADEAVEDAFYDSQALRGFAGIVLNRDPIPDATTVLHFRHWLERHDLTKGLFEEVNAMLEERGLLMRQGTIVDATIIAAPPSTKNKQQSRDPEMHQTKKGNQWYFGMKAHIGVDVASGLVHTVKGTAANEADITQTAALLHGEEEDVFGDAGYTGADKRPELEDRDVSWNIAI